jgi:hypothetical protein
MAITFKDRLAFIEEREYPDYARRVAAVIAALRLSQFSGKNAYAQGHFEHCRQNFDTYLAKAHERCCSFGGVQLDECPGTSRSRRSRHARRRRHAGFMPTYKGGERMYRFLDANVDWPRPSFRTWDPKDYPTGCRSWRRATRPTSSSPITSCRVQGGDQYRSTINKPVYGYLGDGRSSFRPRGTRSVVCVPGGRSGNPGAVDRRTVGAGVKRATDIPAQHLPGQGHRARRSPTIWSCSTASSPVVSSTPAIGGTAGSITSVGLLHRARTTAGELIAMLAGSSEAIGAWCRRLWCGQFCGRRRLPINPFP